MKITIGGPWKFYTTTLPQGAEALGTIERRPGDVGALVRLASGELVQMNAGTVRRLPPEVVAALPRRKEVKSWA